MPTYNPPKRNTRWMATIFMPAIMLVGVIGTPLYIALNGITTAELVLFFTYFFCTGMAITVGYHRLFSHVTYKTNNVIRFLLLFFGAATFQKSALRWASQHRQHHSHTDTEVDPHDSTRGFWFCHMGWIMFYKHHVDFDNVKDLQANKMVMHQHNHYDLWSVGGGLILPMAIGFLIGKPLGVFIMTFCLRTALILNAAFFINSYAHMIGKRTFDKNASARDHWLGAVITNGEGYHSFHHRFPTDYRNGYKWYHWDPSKWFIMFLSTVGLASDLKRTPETAIQRALDLAAS